MLRPGATGISSLARGYPSWDERPAGSPNTLRVLLLADTHLGIDCTLRPRIERRRRGGDFFANLARALEPALRGEVDLVVHGGDLLDRPRVPEQLLEMAMEPLLRVARTGIPVFLVPGNHERRRIPLRLWSCHPDLHVFHEPCTFLHEANQIRVALSGFPCPRLVRESFPGLVDLTEYRSAPADIRLLCLHAAVEGAQVGAHNYTFREGRDVVRGHDVPNGFAAVLAGHIHRGQLLAEDLSGRPLPAPVIYPGSVERTAFAERLEEKGYVLAEFGPSKDGRGKLLKAHFIPLPTRPMMSFVLPQDIVDGGAVRRFLRRRLGALDQHAVVRIQVRGPMPREVHEVLSAPVLRALAPPTMNVTVGYPRRHLGGAARVTGGKQ